MPANQSEPQAQPRPQSRPPEPAQEPAQEPAPAPENPQASMAFDVGEQGRGGAHGPQITRQMVVDDSGVEPSITDFEQIDGAHLPPPGMDNAALAFNLLQSAPSRALAGQLAGQVFAPQQQRDSRANFADLQGAFR